MTPITPWAICVRNCLAPLPPRPEDTPLPRPVVRPGETRRCAKCGVEKSPKAFYLQISNNRQRLVYSAYCRDCKRIIAAARRARQNPRGKCQ